MSNLTFRKATRYDVPFLVDTIIEAEKSGTDILSYTTVFGLTEERSKECLTMMLLEEVDGCELSVSSFILAEKDGVIAAAVAAWIEGMEGIPSLVLKGNLLNYFLPKENSSRAIISNHLLRELHIEYISGTMALGLVYVAPDFRGQNLANTLISERINQLHIVAPDISEIYVQVFGNNLSAIKAYEKAGFKVALVKESGNKEILEYLPSDKKVLMRKELIRK